MDSDDLKITGYSVLIVTFILILIVGATILGEVVKCNAQTDNIGFASRYEIFAGCMIETEPGRWMPLENWRVFDE